MPAPSRKAFIDHQKDPPPPRTPMPRRDAHAGVRG